MLYFPKYVYSESKHFPGWTLKLLKASLMMPYRIPPHIFFYLQLLSLKDTHTISCMLKIKDLQEVKRLVSIEKSVPRDQCSATLGKPRVAEQ